MTEKNRRTFLKAIGAASASTALGTGASAAAGSDSSDGSDLPGVHRGWTPMVDDFRVINNTDAARDVTITATRLGAGGRSTPVHRSDVTVAARSAGDDCVANVQGVTFGAPGEYELSVLVDGDERASTRWTIPKRVPGAESGRLGPTRRLTVKLSGADEVRLLRKQI